ncbi:unnamed protein product [Calicophoron daubneyi]|uniref:Uncharacterized protein n=1 Tax=Calicophoron daubneyi TaxID=300641 RepID=A0AAV2TP79_CALDB
MSTSIEVQQLNVANHLLPKRRLPQLDRPKIHGNALEGAGDCNNPSVRISRHDNLVRRRVKELKKHTDQVQRPGNRLPPIGSSKHKSNWKEPWAEIIETEMVSCPTEYIKRISRKKGKLNPNATKFDCTRTIPASVSDDRPNSVLLTPTPSVQTFVEKSHGCEQAETKEFPVNQSNEQMPRQLSTHNAERKTANAHSKKRISMAATKSGSDGTKTVQQQQHTIRKEGSNTAEFSSHRQPEDNPETRPSFRGKTPDDTEDQVKDPYLSAMEDMIQRHKEISTRSNRTPIGLTTSSNTSVVPGRRIQPLSVIPEDPMMKFTGRRHYHSMGFKVPEKSESLVVEPDHDLIQQVSMLQACERILGQKVGKLSGFFSTKSMSLEASKKRNQAEVDAAETTEDQLSECSIHSELDPLSSRTTTPFDPESEEFLNESRFYFHFNPVVQIFPNQTPWRTRSKLGCVDEEEGESGILSKRPENMDVGVDPMEADMDLPYLRRPSSAGPAMMRKYSTDRNVDILSALRFIHRRYANEPLNYQSVPSSSEMSESTCQFARLVRPKSASDLTEPSRSCLSLPVISSRSSFRCASPNRRTISCTRNILTNSKTSRVRGMFSIHENMVKNPDNPLESKMDDSKTDKVGPMIEEVGDESVDEVGDELREPEYALTDEEIAILKAGHCGDLLAASADPNPMTWFDLLDERLAHSTYRNTFREKMIAQFRLKGLHKRLLSIPQGMTGIQNELEKGWEVRPKPELLLNCVVKHHVLKMPLSVQNWDLIKKIYMNTIVRYPLLFKLILRRREILPQELQHFLNRIMELTETSDRMMATIMSSTTKLATVTTAAKEMDASGFMTGGPKIETARKSEVSDGKKEEHEQGSQGSTTGQTPAKEGEQVTSELETPKNLKKDAGYCALYGKETDFDKGFYTVLRDPASNILEEVALYVPEFAWHVRPLFEQKWANIEDEFYDRFYLNDKERTNRDVYVLDDFLGQTRSQSYANWNNAQKSNSASDSSGVSRPTRQGMLEWPETESICFGLMDKITVYYAHTDSLKPGNAILIDLLTCMHMANYYPRLVDKLVKELDQWIPPLLAGLESSYSSLREETCCVLAYLVCSYRLITRLHVVSKNLLVANITLSILSAIGRYPESYAFYHGLLGYMLHSVPCLSILDCLLLWLPTVEGDETNLVWRDWGLFVYYVIRHWPRNPFYLDALYQKKLLKHLEASYLTKYAKRSARLALSYLVRTCNIRSALLTCWPEPHDELSPE